MKRFKISVSVALIRGRGDEDLCRRWDKYHNGNLSFEEIEGLVDRTKMLIENKLKKINKQKCKNQQKH